MQYIVDHIPYSEYTRPGMKGAKESITVHNTGLPGVPAINFRKSLARADNIEYASFHIVVDNTQAIECIPLDETAYHCADEYGNAHSIGIEVCEIEGAEEKAAELIASMLGERGWNIGNVTTHQKWSGKYCPRLLIPRWDWFLGLIKSKMGGDNVLKIYPGSAPDTGTAMLVTRAVGGQLTYREDVTEKDAGNSVQIGGGPQAPVGKAIIGADLLDTASKAIDWAKQYLKTGQI